MEDGIDFYSKYLMKTEMGLNQNQFYAIQLLFDKDTNNKFLWTRYGRVGTDGISKLAPNGTQKEFNKMLKQKLGKAKQYIPIEFKLGK